MLTKNQTLSRGTLRPEDLLQALVNALDRCVSDHAVRINNGGANGGSTPWGEYAEWNRRFTFMRECRRYVGLYHNKLVRPLLDQTKFNDAVFEAVNELMDELQAYAPDGYYVGFHPGDGALLGVWAYEEWGEE